MQWIERLSIGSIAFIDRDSTIDTFDLYFAPGADLGALFSALRAETAFSAVSDCARCGVSLTAQATRIDEGESTGLNLSVGALTFQTAVNTYGTIAIPGISAAVAVQTGCFAAYALDITHPAVVALAESMISAGACTPRQDVFTQIASGTTRAQWSPLNRRSG